MRKTAIGADLGGTHVRVEAFDEAGQLLRQDEAGIASPSDLITDFALLSS